MDFNHLNFVEAVEDLATFVGVEVLREATDYPIDTPQKELVTDQYQFLEQVAAFYVNCLRADEAGKDAVNYLKARGITNDLAKTFMLGYAPDKWQTLANQFDHKLLAHVGMLIEKDGKAYDRFRGRIMFPIRDKRGRVVGFGGRVLDDSLPKYLNSPETPLFHKSKEVYGLYELLKNNGKPKRILIVEGYMDVIALAGCGIHYAVATLGTATSQAHLELLFRFSPELVFCFDGDAAGREAAWRAMDAAFNVLRDGRQIRIMLLPPQHDPDSLVREEGQGQFEDRVGQSKPLSEFFYDTLASGLNINELEGRSQLINNAKPYLEKLSQGVFRDMMFARLNEITRTKALDVSAKSATFNDKAPRRVAQDNRLLPLPRRIAALLVQYPDLVETLEKKEIIWDNMEFPGIVLFKAVLTEVLDRRPVNTASLLEHYRNHANEKAIKSLASLELFAKDQKIDIAAIAVEFSDALDNLLAQAKKNALFQEWLANAKKD